MGYVFMYEWDIDWYINTSVVKSKKTRIFEEKSLKWLKMFNSARNGKNLHIVLLVRKL